MLLSKQLGHGEGANVSSGKIGSVSLCRGLHRVASEVISRRIVYDTTRIDRTLRLLLSIHEGNYKVDVEQPHTHYVQYEGQSRNDLAP